MIDTDKYEGHTEGAVGTRYRVRPRNFDTEGQYIWQKEGTNRHGEVVMGHNYKCTEEDLRLIADAPLLLEEVKRLREAFITAVRHIDVESRNEMFNDMDADLQSIWLFRSE